MQQIIRCDSKGRIYLAEEIRSFYGRKFVIVKAPKELILLPVPEDPVKDLEDIGQKLPAKSIEHLKEKILKRARKNVVG